MNKEYIAIVADETVTQPTIEAALGWALQKAREVDVKTIEIREVRTFRWSVTEFGASSEAP